MDVPPLTDIQTRSYDRFLQLDVPPEKRTATGSGRRAARDLPDRELRQDASSLQYLRYELGKPRYDPDECRQLRLTYGRPFRVWLRLNKEQPIEEEVYLGDMPIMIGGGEFIINGAERVVVSQLHRCPASISSPNRSRRHASCTRCRIIPERGSWIEINVTKKDTLGVRIDQSGKFSADDAAAGDGPGVFDRRRHPQGVLPDAKTVKVTPDNRRAAAKARWRSAT